MAGLPRAHAATVPRWAAEGKIRKRNHPRKPRGSALTTYFDTGLITKWYILEADTAAALRLRGQFKPPLHLTPLHRVELTVAWQHKVFRRETPAATVAAALGDLETDIAAGLWRMPSLEALIDVPPRAEILGRRHVATLGTRTLDVLHVAVALVLQASTFVTGDVRQATLASAVGLKVIMHRGPRTKV